MALQYSNLAVALLVAWAAIVIVRSVYRAIQTRQTARKLGCRPPKKLASPWFGLEEYQNLRRASREKRIFPYLESVAARGGTTGTTFELRVLGVSSISTIEPENIKALLATQFNDFALGLRHDMFYPLLGDGIFTLDGAGWSHSRAILRPQFSRDQVADIGMLSEHVDRLFAAFPKDGSAFDIQDYFFRLTLDTATEFLFGESTNSLSPYNVTGSGPLASCGGEEGFAKAFNQSLDFLVERGRAQSLYWLVNPPKFRQLVKQVHEVVDYYVDQALKKYQHPQEEKYIDSRGDRYVFLDALAKETQDRKTLRDQMLNILLAGRDTTASLLSSSFFYLSRHPRVWNRLREEILRAFPRANGADAITIDQIREVKYLRHFLNEVLRLVPPVAGNARFAVKDTSLPVGGGPDGRSPILIKKGQKVAYFVWLMHRRTDLWGEDAKEFRPERWQENGKRGWEYLPFNGGPRICLGQQYALTEAGYVLIRLLQKFDSVENAQPEIIDPRVKSALTVSHADGVRVRLFLEGKASE